MPPGLILAWFAGTLTFHLRAEESLTQTRAPLGEAKRQDALFADTWKERLGHEESESIFGNRCRVGTLYSFRRQIAGLFHSGIERYMFIRICWLSCQHGVYQRNNWQLAWKVCDWMVQC